MVASGILGTPLHLFSYSYLSWFHKGFELVVWDSKKKKKKKVPEQIFFFAIPKAKTIKWMFTSHEDLKDLLEPSHGLVAFVGHNGPCCQRETGVVALCIATAV